MIQFDPIFWEPENDYVLNDFTSLQEKFHESLQNKGYNHYKVVRVGELPKIRCTKFA